MSAEVRTGGGKVLVTGATGLIGSWLVKALLSRGASVTALIYDEEPQSTRGISYLDIHDNWALADRYADNDDNNGLQGVDMGAIRIAAAASERGRT